MMTNVEAAAATPPAGLAAALAAVQAELPEVKKNRSADVTSKEGRFLYSYSYADLADVSAAIMPILGKHGLAFTAFPGHQPDGKFGLRYYLMHSSGAQLEGFYEIVDQGGMQMVGGRITYARRYCLCAVTGVAADEDVDARGSEKPAQRTAQRRTRTTQNSGPAADEKAPGRAAAGPDTTPRGDLPPLPGEDGDAGTAPSGQPAGQEPATAPAPSGTEPDDTDYDTPGTATRGKGGQLTALWTVLNTEFAFSSDEQDKERARIVCEHIIGRELPGTTGDMSFNEARLAIDTLKRWKTVAEKRGESPRDVLIAAMTGQDDAADGQGSDA